MTISVIIPTHNPRRDYFARTLAALQAQTLPRETWELLVVDNGSDAPLGSEWVAWHPRGRIVPEPKLGLTHARLAGLHAATGELLVWSDDDNVLAPDYLVEAGRLFADHPKLGAAGGKSLPVYESAPPDWYRADLAPIGCRDLGGKPQWAQWNATSPRTYPACAPIGAGLVVRREALVAWRDATDRDPRRQRLGRTGKELTSGEDNDINLTLLAQGWQLAYLPGLSLEHLIPPGRLTLGYQRRIARATFRDFTRVLLIHGISPWPVIAPWTAPLRRLRAWFACRAWSGPAAQIRWQGACGQIDGRTATD